MPNITTNCAVTYTKWLKLIPYFRPKQLKNHTPGLHPPGATNVLQIMSLAAYASETNDISKSLRQPIVRELWMHTPGESMSP